MKVPDHNDPIRIRWFPSGIAQVDSSEYVSSDWDDESCDQNPPLGEQGAERNPFVDWRSCGPGPWAQLPPSYSTNLTGNFVVPYADGFVGNFWNTNFLVAGLTQEAYPIWGMRGAAPGFRTRVDWFDPAMVLLGSVLAKVTFRVEGETGVARYTFPALGASPREYVVALSGPSNPGVAGSIFFDTKRSTLPDGSDPLDWNSLEWVIQDWGT